MTEAPEKDDSSAIVLAMERTRLASIRTEFAIMRTGFTIASFGVGITELVGRNVWPDWVADLLTAVFILIGMILVGHGWIHSRRRVEKLEVAADKGFYTGLTMHVVPWLLQVALVALLVLVLLHRK